MYPTPRALWSLALLILAGAAVAQPPPSPAEPRSPISALKPRLIGPASTSGRIVGFAVHPKDRAHYYVAVASGGVWKTTNAGISWTPLFDDQGSYSIGCVALDPKNPSVVWVGTGENNSQRSVGYGDGVYKSVDGGKTWQNVGLKNSEHVGKILIDPKDSDVVYVAAQGPLWGPGGDRGLYRTTDGGKTWNKVLSVSDNTGVTDVVMDPRNPDVLIAAAYQRRRHVWTLINGGPESALYKSTDGGKNWRKLKHGLPTVDLGRIGLAVASSDPDTVYAIVEAAEKKGGVFRSADFGENWEKRNDFDQQGQYYSHLVVDPKEKDRIYVMNVHVQLSDDGGKTLKPLGQKWAHVDHHCMWIDPNNTDYYLVGCDGGIYESFDRGKNWRHHSNLPVTQFYDVTADESGPFYMVYGGTQDNFTLGAPARTRSVHGITNADWFVVQGGDGFHCKVDPKDPNTVYAESQYGVLVRYDRRTGQKVGITPQPDKGEPPLRWNWDSPLTISPHSNTRLYYAANRLFQSDDRGNTWKPISGDLTRQLNRDQLEVMGKVWGPDAVAKHLSTSFYGNITALAESPKKEGLLYAGTDDGLVQVTEDGGKTWKKLDKFPGVPDRTYVSRIVASQHEPGTVYVTFDNHKRADFAPYILKSTDSGTSWQSVAGDLPARGSVKAIAEDHKARDLLFVGTEFGLYYTLDGGKKWQRLKNGLPTINVKDLVIQRPMNDLVIGTFGRGIYILDDYSPLRSLGAEASKQAATLYDVRDAVQYVPTMQYGGRGKAFLGEAFYTADNPPFGAVFTYNLGEAIKTRKQKRQEAEKKAIAKGEKPPYPTPDELRAEDEEEPPAILLTVFDASGKEVRTLTGPVTAGMHRVSWDLRGVGASLGAARTEADDDDDDAPRPSPGPWVLPGAYTVRLNKRVGGVTTSLGESRPFNVVADGANDEPARRALFEFQADAVKLDRALSGLIRTADELGRRLDQVRQTLDQTPGIDGKLRDQGRELIQRNRDVLRELRGDAVLRRLNENVPVSLLDRLRYVSSTQSRSLMAPTATQREALRIVGEEFGEQRNKLKQLIDVDLKKLEKALDDAGAPWTPGRLPELKEK